MNRRARLSKSSLIKRFMHVYIRRGFLASIIHKVGR